MVRGRRPRRPRFRLIRFRSRRGQLQLVVGSGGDKAFAPRAVQLAFQTGHFRDEFVDLSQELIDARFQRFDLLGLSQNQGLTVRQIVREFHRPPGHHETSLIIVAP